MRIPVTIRVLFLILFSVSCCPGAITFALHLVVACDSADASPPMSVEADTREFCLDQRPILNETDVKSATVANEQEGPWVRLTLTDEASKRLLEASRKNIGNRIAVVLNGRLMAVPVVQAPVSNNIPITGPFTQQQADNIATEFNRQSAHH